MIITTELRVRSRLADQAMESRVGKLPGDSDYDALLTGPVRVSKLDGKPLCVYLPGVLTHLDDPGVYDVLHELRTRISRNRGVASGTKRYGTGRQSLMGSARTYAKPVSSAIAGAIDPTGQQRYCRLTSWTGQNLPKWELLHPLLQEIDDRFSRHVPERYVAQMREANRTDPAWRIPGTAFTTITVNNSYPTGVHKDANDLAAGFSTIACYRKGVYEGGRLVFPQYRLAVDLRHNDLLLMDAHEYHGNTALMCICGTAMNGLCDRCGAERISVVSYFREKLVACGTPAQEQARADANRDRIEQAYLDNAKGQT